MWKPNKHCLLDSKPVQSIGLYIHSHKNILNNAAKASKNHVKQSERCKTLARGKQSPRRKIWQVKKGILKEKWKKGERERTIPEQTGDGHNAIVKNSAIEEDDEEEEEEEAKSLFSTTNEQRKSRELRPRSCR
jgi:hypothetical protein